MGREVTVAGAIEGINIVFPVAENKEAITSLVAGQNILARDLRAVFPDSCETITTLKIIGGAAYFPLDDSSWADVVLLPNLETVYLEHVKELSYRAFCWQSKLKRIRFSRNLEIIDAYAFSDIDQDGNPIKLPNIETVIVEDLVSWCNVELGNEFSNPCYSMADGAITEEGSNAPVSVLDSSSIQGAKVISAYTFINCQSLTSINLPNSIVEIGYAALRDCRAVESVVLPNSLTAIREDAFSGCTGITSLSAPDGLTLAYLGVGAFRGCDLNLFDTTTMPGLVMFSGYVIDVTEMPTSLVLTSNAVKGFANFLFMGNGTMTNMTLGGSITSIPSGNYENGAFARCSKLVSVELLDSIVKVGMSAFWDCTALASLSLGSNVEIIDDGAFRGCTSLTDVLFPMSLTRIGASAFEECTALVSVTFPSGLKEIGEYAFSNCGLESINIPDSVVSMGQNVFADCTSLRTVSLGEGLTRIPAAAFVCCTSLTQISIPNNIEAIEDYAFAMYDGNDYVANNLGRVVLGDSIKTIGNTAFGGCNQLTSLVIPDATTSLGIEAFTVCTKLESIIFGKNLGTVGAKCFNGCTSLKTMKFLGDAPKINEEAFKYVPASCMVLVSKEAKGWGTVPGTWQGFSTNYFDSDNY